MNLGLDFERLPWSSATCPGYTARSPTGFTRGSSELSYRVVDHTTYSATGNELGNKDEIRKERF